MAVLSLAPLIAKLVRSGMGLIVLTMVVTVGMSQGAAWENPQNAFLPAHLPLFLVGIGSYHFFARVSQKPIADSAMSTLPCAVLLTIAAVTGWHSVALAVWAIAFGCLFAHGPNPFAKILCTIRETLGTEWLQRLGKISYPLYLVHWPMILVLLSALLGIWPSITSLPALVAMLAVGLPIILLTATLLHRFVEHPGMAMGKRIVLSIRAAGFNPAGLPARRS